VRDGAVGALESLLHERALDREEVCPQVEPRLRQRSQRVGCVGGGFTRLSGGDSRLEEGNRLLLTESERSLGAPRPAATVNRTAGRPLARPEKLTPDSLGRPGWLVRGGHPLSVSVWAAVVRAPFCPVNAPPRGPVGFEHEAPRSAFGPPRSETVSFVTGTSGIVGNVTVWFARSILPTSVSTAGGGNCSVIIGAVGDPVRYAFPRSGVGSRGESVVALPTEVLEFWSESAPKFGASVGHGSASWVEELAASSAACVTVVVTAAPLSWA